MPPDERLANGLYQFAAALLAVAVSGCAALTTRVTLLDPAQSFAPTQNAAILLETPARTHSKIALIEVQGRVGGSESQLLEEARRKAQALGADALVRLEVTTVYQEPAKVYDPWYGDPFYWRHPYNFRPPYFYPYLYGMHPVSDYRWVGGGNVQTLKALAIRYGAR